MTDINPLKERPTIMSRNIDTPAHKIIRAAILDCQKQATPGKDILQAGLDEICFYAFFALHDGNMSDPERLNQLTGMMASAVQSHLRLAGAEFRKTDIGVLKDALKKRHQ